ncbi:MAG: hypothetical protein IT470_08245 [Pseudomonadales bacterium]|nr:hypothetical protein [Pseudomonadales bacterium]
MTLHSSITTTISVALEKILFRDDDADALPYLRELIAALRPPRRNCEQEAPLRWEFFLERLHDRPEWREALRKAILQLFAAKRQVAFYTDSGLLPDTGFFTELNRIVMHKLLPEVRDSSELRVCVAKLFSHPDDEHWLAAIPLQERRALWHLLDLQGSSDGEALHGMVNQMTDAVLVLSHRIAAMGLSPELLRVYPRLRDSDSPFMALNLELITFVECFRSALQGNEQQMDSDHVFVMLDQCQETVRKARAASSRLGTSMALSFLLTRLAQHLDRLNLLLKVMTVRVRPDEPDVLTQYWTDFLFAAMEGERTHNSLRRHFSELFSLLALRVTDNAAQVGEHYIASNSSDWFRMLRSAAGAGVLIALLALLKILGSKLGLSETAQYWLNALNYAVGFAVIYILHFIIATKQPAMTAATLAGSISQTHGRLREAEKIVDLIANTVSSQLAAIAGNVMVAFPLAIAFLLAMNHWSGVQAVSAEKAQHILQSLHPFHSASLFHAAIAGVWLFLAGLVSSYLDNRAAYTQLGPRIGQLRGLRMMLGKTKAQHIGDYIANNAGGLGGNIFFGIMLGVTPLLGNLLGLPLDIRHIAFSSANLGYAVAALDFDISLQQWLVAVLGVLMVGFVNLSVSFTLALWVAMRSRRVSFWLLAPVLPRLWLRLWQQPGHFLLAPRRQD